jgi:hypothetical protein
MSNIRIEIGGELVPVEFVWVHLQDAHTSSCQNYTLTVPQSHVKDVFDPTGDCPCDTPIEVHIQALISEVGTFIIDGYLNNIRRLLNAPWSPFRWVIATIEEVANSGSAIGLRGKAIPFVR